jgi:hypothetical protein
LRTVVIVGGKGSLTASYREVVEGVGLTMQHFEKKVPPKRAFTRGALVVIMVSMISHALLDQARALATDGASIVYLRTPSVSALRDALRERNASERHTGPLASSASGRSFA